MAGRDNLRFVRPVILGINRPGPGHLGFAASPAYTDNIVYATGFSSVFDTDTQYHVVWVAICLVRSTTEAVWVAS